MDNMYNNANTDELNIKIAENLKSTASIDFTKLGSDILLNPTIYGEMPIIKYIASRFDLKKNVHDQFYLIKVARFLNAVRYGFVEKRN